MRRRLLTYGERDAAIDVIGSIVHDRSKLVRMKGTGGFSPGPNWVSYLSRDERLAIPLKAYLMSHDKGWVLRLTSPTWAIRGTSPGAVSVGAKGRDFEEFTQQLAMLRLTCS